jgi:hypothetical protein
MQGKQKKSPFSKWASNISKVVLLGVVLSIIGCEKPSDIPADKVSVLDAIRAAGFMFDSTLVDVTNEDSLTTSEVVGPMTGPKVIPKMGEKPPKKGRYNYARYKEVSLIYQHNSWAIDSAELHENQ